MLTKGLKIVKNRFGLLSDGTKVHLYTLSNGKMSVSVCDYGCIITSIVIPDKKHKRLLDVALGPSTLGGWVLNHEPLALWWAVLRTELEVPRSRLTG